MALTITESWIRERVKLKHDHLEFLADDVKSLSLPGTYHEKIFLLGNSLRGFSRLKHLDLSRNSLASTEGLEFLSNLESLNLYYNNISTINDLHHLRHLTNLKDLDLRLNPVTKNEPDYRLFLVHLLPNLRRLDDRSVRDSERRAAVMHFTTDQAAELDADYPPQNPRSYEPEPVRIGIPRAEMVRGLSSRPHVELDDEDVAVLDLVSRTGGDLTKNRRITGSAATRPDADDFTRDELSHMRTTPIKRFESRNTPGIRPHPTARQDKDRVYVKFSPDTQLQGNSDPNLKYTDETDAYDVVSTRGHFTANPTLPVQPDTLANDPMIAPNIARDQVLRRSQESHLSKGRHSERVPPERPLENGEVHASQVRTDKNPVRSFGLSPPRPVQNGFTGSGANLAVNNDGDRQNKDAHGKTEIAESSPQEMETLSKLLDLVDKYWNGSRSLHRNIKFRGMARDILSSSYYQRSANAPDSTLGNRDEEFRAKVAVHSADVSRLRDQVAEQHRELESLREKLREKEGLQTSLQLTNQEQTALKLRMKDIQEENQTLRSKLASLEASNMSVSEQHKCIGDLQKQNSILQEQKKSLNQQVEQQNCNLKQLQDLTNMLQESHRSLVSTNDHLLKELDETRQRHHHEVHQLHWSYDQLKKTVDWLPTSASTK